MLIRSRKSAKTLENERREMAIGAHGRHRQAAAQNIQADIQGGVSDIVRKHEKITAESGKASDPTQEIGTWLDGLADKAPKNPDRQIPVTADRYALVKGRLVLIRKGRR